MVSHHFVYQLVLFALIWFFVVLHLTWPKRPVTAPATLTEPEPLKPKRHRSNEPTPFEGLTQKPVAYLSPADNSHGSLLGRLKGAHQPVIKPRNRFSASCSSLLAGL